MEVLLPNESHDFIRVNHTQMATKKPAKKATKKVAKKAKKGKK